MKYLIFVIVTSFVGALALASSSYAHVLVRDTTGDKGAILHIIPDDDPIAGKKATLYFDTQDTLKDDAETILSISSEDGSRAVVEAKRDDSLVTAEYIFPRQGVYHLRYEIRSGGALYVFEQSTRVARGAGANTQNRPRYAWAEMMLVFTAVTFAVLSIVAFNRRKEIARQSTF